MNNSIRKYKPSQCHLLEEDRIYIANQLSNNISFKDIAYYLLKDPTTISKEIKLHRTKFIPKRKGYDINNCLNRNNCDIKNLCINRCHRPCHFCHKCNSKCSEYKIDLCNRLKRAPLVCNGCPDETGCKKTKFYYKPATAHVAYLNVLSSSREGMQCTVDEYEKLNILISTLTEKGQPFDHIFSHHKDDIPYSLRSIYYHMERNYYNVAHTNMPRYAKCKHNNGKKRIKKDPAHIIGRTYLDFTAFVEANPDKIIWEMDTVEGTKGGKVFLTIFHRQSKLMIIRIIKDQKNSTVLDEMKSIRRQIGVQAYANIFQIILTDRGGEFTSPVKFEFYKNERITNLFYCDPYCSYQKGGIEKNHEYIRYVLPKGKSFNHMTYDLTVLLCSHINSTARKSLSSRTPYDVFSETFGIEIVNFLDINGILPDEVILKPYLLK